MSTEFKGIFQLSILILCVFSINFIAQTKEYKPINAKPGMVYDSYSIDLNGDGAKEQILLKIYRVKYGGWYAKLIVVDKDGKVIWKSQEAEDKPWGSSPFDFGAWNIGISLPEIVGDIDKDGFIEVVTPEPQSDVRPATFNVLRWKNNKFSLVKGGMLLDNPRGSGNYCWSITYDRDLLTKQKQRWITQFISVSSDGKYTVEILDHTGISSAEGDYKIGQAVVSGDEKGFHISEWIEPIPAPQESATGEELQKKLLVDLLDKHYTAINNKNLKDAYNFRSNEWKSAHSYDEFYGNWENNNIIRLEEIKILSRTEEKAEVKIELYSEDFIGSESKEAHYNGTAYLVKENGEWKINDVKVKEKK